MLTADDGVHGRELWSCRLAIIARRPDRGIRDLRAEVAGQRLPHGTERSLTSRLDAADAAVTRGANAVAINRLDTFVQEIQGLSSRVITALLSRG